MLSCCGAPGPQAIKVVATSAIENNCFFIFLLIIFCYHLNSNGANPSDKCASSLDMTSPVSIGILVTLLIQQLAVIFISLVQEVRSTDTNPVESRFLGKLSFQLSFQIIIYRRLHILRHDGCREKAHVVEHVRILLGDVHGMETSHGQSGNGTSFLIGLCTVSLIDELHHTSGKAVSNCPP